MEEHTAGLVVIGDEILRGQVEDKNTSYLAKRLATVGFKLRKVVTVPDVVNEIAEEVRLLSSKYSVVFTAGGVGPTHDDVTYSAIAKGLGLKFEENRELLSIYAELFPGQVEARRLAKVPTPCEIIYVPSPDSSNSCSRRYPVIKAANVYVLPGSPSNFVQAVEAIVPHLKGGTPSHGEFIDVNLVELEFVDILDDFAKRWEGRVNVGSYPQPGSTRLTRITLEGRSKTEVDTARGDLQAVMMPREIDLGRVFTLGHAQVVKTRGDKVPHVKIALDILLRCYNEYADRVFMNFNGGKDCTAVLHLWATVLKLNGASPPLCLYVSEDPFPEVEEFVDYAGKFYGLEVVRKTGSIRSALEFLIKDRNHLEIGIMGMRRGDPGSDKLEPFATTDNGWPAMIRVNPILDWSYSQVWEFLLEHKVPYCSLYDRGYTSLGAKTTTKPNPLLKDASNPAEYLPAHTLTDGSVERQGRG